MEEDKMSISVVYWSGTGNTQAMAEAVAEGIKAAGQEAELLEVGNADAATVAAGNAFALGCPSMGSEQLEEAEMEPFIEEIESLVSGKTILLFGSYGWGDDLCCGRRTDSRSTVGGTLQYQYDRGGSRICPDDDPGCGTGIKIQ